MRTATITIGLLLGYWMLADAQGNVVPYPAGYRHWSHVKSTIIGAQHPAFASNGGIHHFYANEKALEGYKTGKFPDGSVLIDDRLEAKESGGLTSEGPRCWIAVMVKEGGRFPDTGGWGFEVFKGDESVAVLNAEGKASCFACHGKQKDRDSTFTEFRK